MSNTPEHDKRTKETIHPDIIKAYEYVESVKHTTDFKNDLAWHGWALREAFLAGISYAEKKSCLN